MTRKSSASQMLSHVRAVATAERPAPSPLSGDRSPVTGTPKRGGPKWEETNRKTVFYLAEDVEALIRSEMARSGGSKSQVISETLRAQLGGVAVDAGTLASYATVAVAAFTIAAGLAGAAWKVRTRRQAAGVDVSVDVSAGFLVFGSKADPPLVIVVVRNPLDHPVTVTGVAIEMNNGSDRFAVEPWVHPGATIPGEVASHGEGRTWFDMEQLVKGGLEKFEPMRARITLADRSRFLWSLRTTLMKR